MFPNFKTIKLLTSLLCPYLISDSILKKRINRRLKQSIKMGTFGNFYGFFFFFEKRDRAYIDAGINSE